MSSENTPTRRSFLRNVALGAGALTLTPCLTRASEASSDAEPAAPAIIPSRSKPNVLFIAVDDLRPEIRCFGAPGAVTPHIDALAERGVAFTRTYCQQAVCSPSRTSLMTGCRPDTAKVHDLVTHFRTTIPDVVTLSQHFMAHGWYAQGMGKIYHGSLQDGPSWSAPLWRPSPIRPSPYISTENEKLFLDRNAALAHTIQENAVRVMGSTWEKVPDSREDETGDVRTANHAIDWIEDRAARSSAEPFFLGVGFMKPHLPFIAPQRFWDLHPDAGISLSGPGSLPVGAPVCAANEWEELNQYYGSPKNGPVPPDLARSMVRGYRACVSYTDEQIGRLLAALDHTGLRDNTIVVLWSDHGFQLGEHGQWCKHNNFERSARVPLVISAPGIRGAGLRSDSLVELSDIYPTLCAQAGLPTPEHVEGADLTPLLHNPRVRVKTAAFNQYPREIPGVGRAMGHAVRTDGHRYCEWRVPGTDWIERELYSLDSPGAIETRNLASDPACVGLIEHHAALLRGGWRGALVN